jgi:hypothetical protein
MVERQFYPMSFSIDDSAAFAGHAHGQYWNGWACPAFERAEAERVMQAMYVGPGAWWEYDAPTDTFRGVLEGGAPEDIDEWQGSDILVDGRSVHVYFIGAWAWIWDEIGPEPAQ